MNEAEFSRKIAARLQNAEVRFEQGRLIDGFRADFIVYAPDERFALIEAMSWRWQDGNVARAGELASSIQERTGASAVFIVLENLDRNFKLRGVYKLDGIVNGVKRWFREKTDDKIVRPGTGRLRLSGKAPGQAKTLFAAMPFERQFDDTFVFAMTPAAEAISGEAIRVDQEHFTEQIVDRIKTQISNCAVMVADISKSNPNVLYELGYARGQSIPCIQICSTSLNKLPFDVRGFPTIPYELGSVSKLVPKLVKTVTKLAE